MGSRRVVGDGIVDVWMVGREEGSNLRCSLGWL
jgi:hypothetical protein